MTPLFLATEKFDSSDGKRWDDYVAWSKIPGLIEVVSVDAALCPPILRNRDDADWDHIVNENFRPNYFRDLDYLLGRVAHVTRQNILGLYRDPSIHVDQPPGGGGFDFMGYDLVEDITQVSALTNCGGFLESFGNDELNCYGLIPAFGRASQVRKDLLVNNPSEPHARCELYAVWRLAM